MKFHYISTLLLGQWMFICIVRLIIFYRQYVALSHSWGKAQVITATSQTLDQYKRCLPYMQLPQTFRDAIAIARRLAIGLLWIDSLCIIQDSTLDWEEQAAADGFRLCQRHFSDCSRIGLGWQRRMLYIGWRTCSYSVPVRMPQS